MHSLKKMTLPEGMVYTVMKQTCVDTCLSKLLTCNKVPGARAVLHCGIIGPRSSSVQFGSAMEAVRKQRLNCSFYR